MVEEKEGAVYGYCPLQSISGKILTLYLVSLHLCMCFYVCFMLVFAYVRVYVCVYSHVCGGTKPVVNFLYKFCVDI